MGSAQVIICKATTVRGVVLDSVRISWLGPRGYPVTTNCRVTISPTTSSGNTFTSTLHFDYLVEDDEGMYTCNVMILEASGSSTVELPLKCKQNFIIVVLHT